MVTDHQHVQMLINRVSSVGSCWIGRRRQNIPFTAHPNYVRGVSSSCPFRMVGVDSPPLEGFNWFLHTRWFVQCVRMYGNLLLFKKSRKFGGKMTVKIIASADFRLLVLFNFTEVWYVTLTEPRQTLAICLAELKTAAIWMNIYKKHDLGHFNPAVLSLVL